MTEKTPKERFLEAAGAKASKAREVDGSPEAMLKHLEQMQRTVDTVLQDVQVATAAATASQGNAKRLFDYLNGYCQDKMPEQMRRAFEQVAREVYQEAARPLEDGVRRATADVEALDRQLYRFNWFWFRDLALCGLAAGLIGSLMVHCTLNQKLAEMDEGRRYELWGRVVEQKVAQLPPEKRKKFRAWLGSPYETPGK